MPDEHDSLSESEALRYRSPQTCSACGERTLYYDLVPVADLGNPETRYILGQARCRNPRNPQCPGPG